MRPTCLGADEQKQVCEDLFTIQQAGRMAELAAVRLKMLRVSGSDCRSASPWVQIETDRIAKTASRLVCGSPDEWMDAASAALNRPSRVDVCIEAIRQVAEQIRAEESRQQPPTLPVRVNIQRKRGGR